MKSKCASPIYTIIVNRFDESAVMLAFRLNLTLCDVLYTKSKDSHDAATLPNGHPNVHLSIKDESQAVQDVYYSAEVIN